MLFVHDVRPEKADRIPAVRHTDGTARIQTVNRAQHPLYYDLLRAFHARTAKFGSARAWTRDSVGPSPGPSPSSLSLMSARGVSCRSDTSRAHVSAWSSASMTTAGPDQGDVANVESAAASDADTAPSK